MCGIFSIINKKGSFRADVNVIAKEVQKALVHRGPENSSYECLNNSVLLLHNRLSIIDLDERSNQPLWDKEKSIVIILNGEIYNYRELKSTLVNEYAFNTTSDTEVILNLYKKHGTNSFAMLDGIFAFVLFDTLSNTVYVVRDKVGKKPLYLYEDAENIFVSSEIKAFYCIPGFTPSINYHHVDYVMSFFHTPNLSPFINVQMMDPGTYHKYEMGHSTLHCQTIKYFDIFDLISSKQYSENLRKRENIILDEFEALLLKAVEKRLIADVPVVSTNSGGIDSSLVSAMAAKFNKDIKLFHVDVEGNSEIYYAKLLAEYLGAELISIPYNESLFNEYFEQASNAYEYFMIHPNNVALFALAKEVRNMGYKVILAGESADELSGGYGHLAHYMKNYNKYKAVPSGIKIQLQKILSKLNKNVLGNHVPGFNQNYLDGNNAFLKIHIENELIEKIENCFLHIKDVRERKHRTLLMYDYLRYLQPLFLRGDKMFMAHSVELRLPFADVDLLAYTINLPAKYVNNKYIIRKTAEKYLPKEIIHRSKKGFPTNYKMQFEGSDKFDIFDFKSLNVKNQISLLGLKYFMESSKKNGKPINKITNS